MPSLGYILEITGVRNLCALASELHVLGEAAADVAICIGKQSIQVRSDVLFKHKLKIMLSQRKIGPLCAFSLLHTRR